MKTWIIRLGGAGSGNFGHSGRPGKVGGSVPRSSGNLVSVSSPYTALEKAAIISYKGEFELGVDEFPEGVSHLNSYQINGYWREKTLPSGMRKVYLSGQDKSEIKQLSSELDSAIKKGKTTEDLTVYRGVSIADAENWWLAPGEVIGDRSFFSTTSIRERADFFAGGEEGVVLEIKLPKGSKALFVDPISPGPDKEGEYLLPRNSRFKVLDVQTNEKGGSVVTVEPSHTRGDFPQWFVGNRNASW